MKTSSCDFSRLYASGGPYEDDERVTELAAAASVGTWLADVYPPYEYERPLPRHVLSDDPHTEPRLREMYAARAGSHPVGPPSQAFELRDTILYDRTLYAVVPPGQLVAVYETDRATDRAWKEALDPALLENARKPRASGLRYAYFGSVGGGNYAHWLVDDLPRAKAFAGIAEPPVVVLDAYNAQVDAVRAQTLEAVAGGVRSIFIDRKVPYFFDRLTFVTPTSTTPVLKSPGAIAFLREKLGDARTAASPRRLFVNRKALWRNLFDAEAVAAFLTDLSFTVVTPDAGTTVAQQARLFANAEIVVGVAGAAMVNALFSPPSARIFSLAGEGFVDPWYWDLANACGQEYSVCFGTPWKPNYANFSSFTIGTERLSELASLL